MMKYVETAVTFSEVPDEISLCINISECKIQCPDCHSKYLWESIGTDLTEEELKGLINKNDGITCVSFMGGNPADVQDMCKVVRNNYPSLKTAWYTGLTLEKIPLGMDYSLLNFLKVGPYKKHKGGLDKETTNQSFYEIRAKDGYHYLVDCTYKFQKNG